MAGLLRGALRWYSGVEHAEVSTDSLSLIGDRLPYCLVLGEHACGKTSLLFLAAILAAAEEGKRVLFISRSPIQTLPAPLVGLRARLGPLSLKKIQFLYPRSSDELLQVVASVHENEKLVPSLIIVDGLNEYAATSGHHFVAHVSALLVDTAAFLTERFSAISKNPEGVNSKCSVIVSLTLPSCTDDETEGSLNVIERYFPVRCWLEKDTYSPEGVVEGQNFRVYFSEESGIEPQQDSASGSQETKEWKVMFRESGEMTVLPLRPSNSGTM
ncbi:ATPase SWSAP1 isoform X2 [Protopterus annectens]|uniref:ATPase SWSAP1 isoform X2 n=1 Tax=Protopterus annectens TaxID=7888 RepID=UPI001CF964ED|nr:ATPase SWSAP1 isoform X2 [Protopterus annectens]